jgi:hypothetical protein
MPIFTREQFRNVASARAGNKTFSQILLESKNETRENKTTSVFLSHSHTDKDLVEEAVAFFKGQNINIYVDWMDETMPEKTNGMTARRIKQRIINDDKFVLLATNNAVSSKWCNWELGIGDSYKAPNDKLLILPLADNKGNWTGDEYIQIYPWVEPITTNTNNYYDNIFRVYYPNGTYKSLHDWLRS